MGALQLDMKAHTGIVGITRSGKTVLANYLYSRLGGLFIDFEDKQEIQSGYTLTKKSSPQEFDKIVSTVNKVRYVPDPEPEKATKEAYWIANRLLRLNVHKHVWVDELQTYGGSRKNAFDALAVRGLKSGIHLNWMTQRPANASKTIASQTNTLVFFDMSSFEKKYFGDYDLPYEEIREKIDGQPPYYFVIYVRGKGVSEPMKLSL